MAIGDLLPLLAETTAASTAAIVLVLLVRRGVRRAFGATVGYATWIVVPVALVAVTLPGAAGALDVLAPAWAAVAVGAPALAATPGAGMDVSAWLGLAWWLGAVSMASRLALQQRAFVRTLGVLRDRGDSTHQAEAVAGLPAVIGVFRPRTVLPADFDTRYGPHQQELLRAHERIHLTRGDVRVNAAVAAFRCVFWFNPLVHFAARVFRLDQEMACDEGVVAKFPSLRRAYGEAMLQTQLALQPAPLGCHWGFQHPLRERIDMLRKPRTTPLRWIAGSGLVLTLAMAFGVAAWAAQPAGGDKTAPVAGEHTPPPAYPAGAAVQGIGGRVVLLIELDATGRPTQVTVESAEPAGVFDQVAVDAARAWSFKPAIENGKAVPSRVRVPVDFAPDGPPAEIRTVNQYPAA